MKLNRNTKLLLLLGIGILLLLTFKSIPLDAAPTVVQLYVKDGNTQKPVSGATIKMSGNNWWNYTLTTDSNGYASYDVVAGGDYVFTITAIGYPTLVETHSIPVQNSPLVFTFLMGVGGGSGGSFNLWTWLISSTTVFGYTIQNYILVGVVLVVILLIPRR